MAVKTWNYVHGVAGNVNRQYICDTEGELPSSGLIAYGDQAYTKDSKKLWIAITATTWEEMSPGGGSPGGGGSNANKVYIYESFA